MKEEKELWLDENELMNLLEGKMTWEQVHDKPDSFVAPYGKNDYSGMKSGFSYEARGNRRGVSSNTGSLQLMTTNAFRAARDPQPSQQKGPQYANAPLASQRRRALPGPTSEAEWQKTQNSNLRGVDSGEQNVFFFHNAQGESKGTQTGRTNPLPQPAETRREVPMNAAPAISAAHAIAETTSYGSRIIASKRRDRGEAADRMTETPRFSDERDIYANQQRSAVQFYDADVSDGFFRDHEPAEPSDTKAFFGQALYSENQEFFAGDAQATKESFFEPPRQADFFDSHNAAGDVDAGIPYVTEVSDAADFRRAPAVTIGQHEPAKKHLLALTGGSESGRSERARNMQEVPQAVSYSSQSNSYSPQPDSYSPQPNSYSPQPNSYSPQPNSYSPQPDSYSPQPDSYSPQPNNDLNGHNNFNIDRGVAMGAMPIVGAGMTSVAPAGDIGFVPRKPSRDVNYKDVSYQSAHPMNDYDRDYDRSLQEASPQAEPEKKAEQMSWERMQQSLQKQIHEPEPAYPNTAPDMFSSPHQDFTVDLNPSTNHRSVQHQNASFHDGRHADDGFSEQNYSVNQFGSTPYLYDGNTAAGAAQQPPSSLAGASYGHNTDAMNARNYLPMDEDGEEDKIGRLHRSLRTQDLDRLSGYGELADFDQMTPSIDHTQISRFENPGRFENRDRFQQYDAFDEPEIYPEANTNNAWNREEIYLQDDMDMGMEPEYDFDDRDPYDAPNSRSDDFNVKRTDYTMNFGSTFDDYDRKGEEADAVDRYFSTGQRAMRSSQREARQEMMNMESQYSQYDYDDDYDEYDDYPRKSKFSVGLIIGIAALVVVAAAVGGLLIFKVIL